MRARKRRDIKTLIVSSFVFSIMGWAIVLIRKNGKKSEKHRLQP